MTSQNEAARIHALHQLKLIDTSPSESFDRITRMAGRLFGLDTAAISLTDSDRQWFKSRLGISDTSMPRHDAPCNEVTQTSRTLVVPDLLDHSRYVDSTLAGTGARFYAGAPLITQEGHCLGSLCVVGGTPRSATNEELSSLGDLAAMVMAQIELQHAYGRVDAVSGLANRNQFIEDLHDLALDTPARPRIAVLVDLAQNSELDSVGRVMGPAYVDEIVRGAVRSMQSMLPEGGTAYHVAATQLVFLAPSGAGRDFLDRIEADLSGIRTQSSISFSTTVAIGAVPFVLGETSPQDVLRMGYSAAQDARTNERVLSVYSCASDDSHRRRHDLLNAFAAALDEPGQLSLVYQPRIDLGSGRCASVEALLRWRHPVLGEISPAEFIPIIERTSLMAATTTWVIDRAMRQTAEWISDGLDLCVSINVSAANLCELDFAARVQLYLLKYRLHARSVEIELTESAIMSKSGHAMGQLSALRDAGVRLAIDDFGTGYSSLSYLQRLPAHVVKIDQSFLRDLTADTREHALVRSMITLSHDLGYRVVAEGVETALALELLIQLGCDEAQGFLFARPLAATDIKGWVRDRSDQDLRLAA